MEPSELLQKVADLFESLKVPYLITGSMATIVYGEPRFTNDIDVVAVLDEARVDAFCAAFPSPEYYCSRDAVRQAVMDCFQFNVIHPSSGLKVDVIVPSDTEFNRSRLKRGVQIPTGSVDSACFASPEDVIIKKLEYYREGTSEKHLRDIVGVLMVRGRQIDRDYIVHWTDRLGLADQWQLVLARENESKK